MLSAKIFISGYYLHNAGDLAEFMPGSTESPLLTSCLANISYINNANRQF